MARIEMTELESVKASMAHLGIEFNYDLSLIGNLNIKEINQIIYQVLFASFNTPYTLDHTIIILSFINKHINKDG